MGSLANVLRRLERRFRFPRPDLEAWRPYARLAREAGLTRPTLFLSFDCDTDQDALVLPELDALLSGLGIAHTLAVPGVQLRNSPAVYRALADAGLEFMNHGHAPHTVRRDDVYVSTTFYEAMDPRAVEDDIRQGHAAVLAVTGRSPAGFRAPHFGLFQQPDQLALIRRTARSLGYAYCSTTTPATARERGPVFVQDGLVELPLFGTARIPHRIFDSWSYLEGAAPYRLSPDYARLGMETVDFFCDNDLPVLLSWYADPSHVHGQPAFGDLMTHLARRGVPSLTGTGLARAFAGEAR